MQKKISLWPAFIAGGFLLLGAGALAQAEERAMPGAEAITAFMEAAIDQVNAPGAAVAVVEDGAVTFAGGFGRIDDSGAPVTAQTPFQIGSITKSFTSLVVLQMGGEGRLGLDDPVINYVPDFAMADMGHARAVTIRQLMDHTSGFTTLDGNQFAGCDGVDPVTMACAVRALSGAEAHAPPGAAYQYSNANYKILGHLIEVMERKPYNEVLEARIFSKIGMPNTFVREAQKTIAPEAKGHALWFGFPRERHLVGDRKGAAAGAIVSSAEDMAKYLLALLERDPRIVPPTLAQSWAREPNYGYEFGWQHWVIDGKREILHDGLTPGFRARAMLLPDQGKAAVVFVNMSGVLDGNMPMGATYYALGLPPLPVAPSFMIKMAIWGTLAGVLGFAFGCVRTLRQAYGLRNVPWPYPKPAQWAILLLPPIGLLGLAYGMLVLVPASLAVSLEGARVFYPDLAFMLQAMGGIAVFWAVAMPLLLSMRPSADLAAG